MAQTNDDSILIVLVLYKCKIEDSSSFSTLMKNRQVITVPHELIIYNNSPEIRICESDSYLLAEDTHNGMLVKAYNYALDIANRHDRKWILLLDQDTILTESYLRELSLVVRTSPNVSAVIPIVKKGIHHISPFSYNSKIGISWMTKPLETEGKTNLCLSAINTGALLNVETINSLGGFSNQFPLDSLDHWYFYEFYLAKKSIWILSSTLEHNISLLDGPTGMTSFRYNSFLESGLKLARLQGLIPCFLWKLRCLFRGCKYYFSKNKRKHSNMLFSYVLK